MGVLLGHKVKQLSLWEMAKRTSGNSAFKIQSCKRELESSPTLVTCAGPAQQHVTQRVTDLP